MSQNDNFSANLFFNICMTVVLTIVICGVGAMMYYSYTHHRAHKMPWKVDSVVYDNIKDTRNLNFFRVTAPIELSTENPLREYLLLDMFYKGKGMYLNIALAHALGAPDISQIKITGAELVITELPQPLPTTTSTQVKYGGDIVYNYFKVTRSQMNAAINIPHSYLRIKTNRGDILEEISAKCPEYRAHHWHAVYGHNHSELNDHTARHIYEAHTSEQPYVKFEKPHEIRNLCAQMKVMLKLEKFNT